MNGTFQRVRRLCVAGTTIGITLSVAAVAMARAETPDPYADKSGWVLGYALVVLAIALGLTAVCRPGGRSKDIQLEEE